MKYKVLETYTPDDTHSDRTRKNGEFESDSTDLLELALLARIACYDKWDEEFAEETKDNIRRRLRESDVADQLADQELEAFEFTLFGNSGEWCLEVEAFDAD